MDFDDLDKEEVDRKVEEDGPSLEAAGEAFLNQQACPCYWRIIRRCMVTSTAHQSNQGAFQGDVLAGSIVKVTQMKHDRQEHRVRGRLECPSGWITLLTTYNGEVTAEVLEDANSGVFEVTNSARVTSTLSLQASDGCRDIGDLQVGSWVHILEVALTADERRLRGRLEHPYDGWLSLLNTENDYRWAERQPAGVEAPLLTVQGTEVGDTVRLLSDVGSLTEACEELASLTPVQCRLSAGAAVSVLEVDSRYQRLKCTVPLFGDAWFAPSCFVWSVDAGAFQAAPEPESPRQQEPFTAREAWREAPSEPCCPGLPCAEVELALPTEAEAQALANLRRQAQAPPPGPPPDPAPEAPRPAEPNAPAPKEGCTLEDFPVGSFVELLEAFSLRQGERTSSKELLRLERGGRGEVLQHGSEPGSRRLRVREQESQLEGWLSCATKGGRPLLSLLTLQSFRQSAPIMPSVEEVLDKIDEDELLQDGGVTLEREDEDPPPVVLPPEPDDPVTLREKAEEARAVWRGFKDLARLDTAEEIRGLELEAIGEESRRQELLRWGGWDNPQEEQVQEAEDRRLRLMEAELLKREAKERRRKEKVQRAMDRHLASEQQAMPRAMAISGRPARASDGPSLQLLAVEDLRQRLDEERQEALCEEWGQEEAFEGHASEWEVLQEAQLDEPVVEPGAIVRVHSLVATAELNGLEGMVERWDSKTERWVVQLQNGQCKKLRERNLVPCEGCEEAAAEEEDCRGFSGAPFAVSMRNGHEIAPPRGDLTRTK